MREQRAQHTPIPRRASATTCSRSHAPATATSVEVDEEREEVYTRPPTRTSARRYDLVPVRKQERRTEALLPQGKHPLFYIGICMIIMMLFLTGFVLIPPALQKWSDDRIYGYPRSYQTDANVGHGGVSHFIALNNHGTIEVLEIPTDRATRFLETEHIGG